MNTSSSKPYSRRPLYPGPPKTGVSGVQVKYTNQKELRDRRMPAMEKKLSSTNSNSLYDEVNQAPYKRIQISD